MKPLFNFLISPIDGDRYSNKRTTPNGIEYHISSSIEDFRSSQRLATVVCVPIWYKGEVEVGDTIITHHNTFRKFLDNQGREQNSTSYVRDNLFITDIERMYMVKKKGSDEWKAIDPYIFVSPVEEGHSLFNQKSFKQLFGKVEYSPVENIKSGDVVCFTPDSEYEFRIDDKLMYRMYVKNINLIEAE